MDSELKPILEEKGGLLNPNSYWGINLLEHAFKLYEILDRRLREVVDIDKSQYGFISGRETINAAFVLRKFCEKVRVKNKCYIFLDLERTFGGGCAKRSYSFCFEAEECSGIFGTWNNLSL